LVWLEKVCQWLALGEFWMYQQPIKEQLNAGFDLITIHSRAVMRLKVY
jgi:Holliday junction resolvase-like predicted endonuclease